MSNIKLWEIAVFLLPVALIYTPLRKQFIAASKWLRDTTIKNVKHLKLVLPMALIALVYIIYKDRK